MSLDIKNAETRHLVQELAALTGETQTAAVTTAAMNVHELVMKARQGELPNPTASERQAVEPLV